MLLNMYHPIIPVIITPPVTSATLLLIVSVAVGLVSFAGTGAGCCFFTGVEVEVGLVSVLNP